MPKLRVLVAGALAVVVLGACGSDDDDSDASSDTTAVTQEDVTTTVAESSDTTEAESTDTTTAPAGDVAVAVATTSLGETLVDKDGFTLYQFTQDTVDVLGCVAACTTAWPPVIVTGDPVVADGLDASKFGTVEREDGTMQVIIDGHPLYRFASDTAPGDIKGHALGDVWFATGVNGEKLGA